MKHKLLRLLKGAVLGIIIAATVIFSIYTMAWFALTKRAEAYMNVVWSDKDFTITGERPSFSGYPMPPEANFSGSFAHKSGFTLTVPNFNYSGFPLVHQIQYFEAPNGLKLSSNMLDQDLSLDYAALQIRSPYRFPHDLKRTSVAAWQKSEDPFVIPKIILKSGDLSAIGSGTISLDDNLQIKADIDARIVGMDNLLDNMEETQGKRNVAVARNFLNMMSKKDPLTGQSYFETTIKIQNRGLYLGPLRITGLPELTWE